MAGDDNKPNEGKQAAAGEGSAASAPAAPAPAAPTTAPATDAKADSKDDGRTAVVFKGHRDPDNHTQVIRTADGDFRVGQELRLSPEKLAALRSNGYLLDPVH